jgi:hypothetical protein
MQPLHIPLYELGNWHRVEPEFVIQGAAPAAGIRHARRPV